MKRMLMFLLVCSGVVLSAQNLLQDGNFASGKFGTVWREANWVPYWGTKTMKDGVLTFTNDKFEQYTLVFQAVKLVPGKYTISFEAKSDIRPSKAGKFTVKGKDGKESSVPYIPSAGPEISIGGKTVLISQWGLNTRTPDWKKFSRNFEVKPAAKGPANAAVPGTLYLMLRHSTGTVSYRNMAIQKN